MSRRNRSVPTPKGMEGIPMTDIVDPVDVDVLCGRGGAALRHPGNQTYRRLVNLNKGLYITCLKTEKLKISRSIVAAIREQKGRFLERNGDDGTWFDIGDKKAIEKTSQALREGQPKLRQKMVEMGGTQPGLSMDHQFPNGIYNPSGMVNHGMNLAAFSNPHAFSMGGMGHLPHPAMNGPQHNMMANAHAANMMNMNSNGMGQMPPPANRQLSQDMGDMMMKQLSLNSNHSVPQQAQATRADMPGNNIGMPPQAPQAHDLPLPQHPDASAMVHNGSTFGQAMPLQSAMKNSSSRLPMASQSQSSFASHGNLQLTQQHQPNQIAPAAPPPMGASDTNQPIRKLDRRRLFAKMKYSRPASGRFNHSNRSVGADGMPDIHMVDSAFSLMSNLSGQGGKHADHDLKMKDSLSNYSDHGKDYLAIGSRRSLMSGLSKISDSSDVNSIFSDLSRKIGNVSTRSIAMSEISGIEEGYQEDLEESFSMEPTSSMATTAGGGGDLEFN